MSLRSHFSDSLADAMIKELRKNCQEFDITFFDLNSGKQGILHIVGPEQGITQPGSTIACGDSHTSTHGAFGAIAFGVGTSEVRNILATQTMAMSKLKVRRINVTGPFEPRGICQGRNPPHHSPIWEVKGGIGYAYEYGGEVFDAMSMEERMTVCNMSIEGGARCGYVNPDHKTFAYLKGRAYSPKGKQWDAAVERWRAYASDPDCEYDDRVTIEAADIAPTVTWGINPGQGISIDENIPSPDSVSPDQRAGVEEALEFMKFAGGSPIKGIAVDVAFLGSCTNGRLSDLEEVAKYLTGRKVADSVKAIAVPGSQVVAKIAQEKGIDKIFTDAGFEWRTAGCSMCLAMNPDKLIGDQVCASSSNRNFKGRQGSPTGRTLLMSPLMVAAAAVTGTVSDAREVFGVSEPVLA